MVLHPAVCFMQPKVRTRMTPACRDGACCLQSGHSLCALQVGADIGAPGFTTSLDSPAETLSA